MAKKWKLVSKQYNRDGKVGWGDVLVEVRPRRRKLGVRKAQPVQSEG